MTADPPHAFDPILYDYAAEMGWDSADGLPRPEYLRTRNDAVPLVAAAQVGDLATVQSLLAAGADVNATGKLGETALHMAAALGHTTVVSALLASGAPPDGPSGDDTPLEHCARFCAGARAVDVAALLLGAGAAPSASALQYAVEAGNTALVVCLLPLCPRERLLRCARDQETAALLLREEWCVPDAVDLREALWRGLWPVFDLAFAKSKASASVDFNKFAGDVLDDLLYERIPHPGCTIVDVAAHFFAECGVDPNVERIAQTVVASGSSELLEVAVKHGLQVRRLGDTGLAELLAEAKGRRAPPEFAERVTALRDTQA